MSIPNDDDRWIMTAGRHYADLDVSEHQGKAAGLQHAIFLVTGYAAGAFLKKDEKLAAFLRDTLLPELNREVFNAEVKVTSARDKKARFPDIEAAPDLTPEPKKK
jgi:hypothetical protein